MRVWRTTRLISVKVLQYVFPNFSMGWTPWWRHLNKFLLFFIFLWIVAGIVIAPEVLWPFFVKAHSGIVVKIEQHIMWLVLSAIVILYLSWLSPKQILFISSLGLMVMLVFLALTWAWGIESAGAKRSFLLPFTGFTVLPSLLIMPFFCVVISNWLSLWRFAGSNHYFIWSGCLTALVVALVFLQPDVDTALFMLLYFGAILFFSGVHPVKWIILPSVLLSFTLLVLVFSVDYIYQRVVSYAEQIWTGIDPYSHEGLVRRAIEQGSFFGIENESKFIAIPKGNNDLVFASFSEVYGVLGHIFLMIMILGFCFSTISAIKKMNSFFAVLACISLLMMLVTPIVAHIFSSLGLLPILGQPLPFLSTGGSSILSYAIALGFILAFTRTETMSIHSSHFQAPLSSRSF